MTTIDISREVRLRTLDTIHQENQRLLRIIGGHGIEEYEAKELEEIVEVLEAAACLIRKCGEINGQLARASHGRWVPVKHRYRQ